MGCGCSCPSTSRRSARCAAEGDEEGARRDYADSLELAGQTGMCFYDAETRRRLAHLARDREAVIEGLGEALDVARSQAARPFEQRVTLDLRALR